MLSTLKNLIAPKDALPSGFSGECAILMADSRGIAKLSERVSPEELVDRLNRDTTALIAAVEKHGGVVHLYVGGSVIAYWPPSKMRDGARRAIAAASGAIESCGDAIAVSVAIAELALSDVGPACAKRPLLVGPAYQRAEATLRSSSSGVVAVDAKTHEALPADIKARFVAKHDYWELP
jgi:class 3 adenylate cyclase